MQFIKPNQMHQGKAKSLDQGFYEIRVYSYYLALEPNDLAEKNWTCNN